MTAVVADKLNQMRLSVFEDHLQAAADLAARLHAAGVEVGVGVATETREGVTARVSFNVEYTTQKQN